MTFISYGAWHCVKSSKTAEAVLSTALVECILLAVLLKTGFYILCGLLATN